MSYGPGARSSNAYHPASTSTSTSASTSHLQARIAQKRAELTHLQSLRDSSATLASQLSVLETKLSTLKDGAQSVALVLANWDNVLRAIGMAASQIPRPAATSEHGQDQEEGPREDEETTDQDEIKNRQVEPRVNKSKESNTPSLPAPLVRIPVQRQNGDGG